MQTNIEIEFPSYSVPQVETYIQVFVRSLAATVKAMTMVFGLVSKRRSGLTVYILLLTIILLVVLVED